MLDPGALGTLIIGLDSARQASEPAHPPAARPPGRRRRATTTFRARVAVALRSAADRLDHRPTSTLESPIGTA